MNTKQGTRKSKAAKTPSKLRLNLARLADEAEEIFHDLLHEYDPLNHRRWLVGYPGGRASGFWVKLDDEAEEAPMIRERQVDEVRVAFGPSCWVIYDYYEAVAPNEQRSAALLSLEYDDPRFLATLFRALRKLGVYVPRRFTASIGTAQQRLLIAVQRATR